MSVRAILILMDGKRRVAVLRDSRRVTSLRVQRATSPTLLLEYAQARTLGSPQGRRLSLQGACMCDTVRRNALVVRCLCVCVFNICLGTGDEPTVVLVGNPSC